VVVFAAEQSLKCTFQQDINCKPHDTANDEFCCAQYLYGVTAGISDRDSPLDQESVFQVLTDILIISIFGFVIDVLWLCYSGCVFFAGGRVWQKVEKTILGISVCSSVIDVALTYCVFGLAVANNLRDGVANLRESNCFSFDAIDEITNTEGMIDGMMIGGLFQGTLDLVGICLVCWECCRRQTKEGVGCAAGIHYFISIAMDLVLGGLNTFYFTLGAYRQFQTVYSNKEYLCYYAQ